MKVTVNGREYTKRGARWTYEPRNNHGRKEVFRGSRLHHALDVIAELQQNPTPAAPEGRARE